MKRIYNPYTQRMEDAVEVGELTFELTSGKVLRATKDSAALDLFYSGSKPLWITDRVCAVPTGVRSKFSPGLVAVIKEKSGLALKGIEIKAGVIDSDYRDEWIVLCRNPVALSSISYDSDGMPICDPVSGAIIIQHTADPHWKPFRLNPGDKIAQFLLISIAQVHVYAMPSAELLISDAIRSGGFGSTDTHAPLPDDPKSTDDLKIPPLP